MHGTKFLLTLCSACSSLRTASAVTTLSGLCRALGWMQVPPITLTNGCIRRSGRVSLRIPFRLRAFSSVGRATDF
jgi:hypothetical protein